MRKILRKTRDATTPIRVSLTLQDLVDLNWALYIARMNEVLTYQNARSRGDEASCDMVLDELESITHADNIVNRLFDEVLRHDEGSEGECNE